MLKEGVLAFSSKKHLHFYLTELFRNSILHQNLSFQQQTTENNNKLDTDEFGITVLSATTEKYHDLYNAENSTVKSALERCIWHVLLREWYCACCLSNMPFLFYRLGRYDENTDAADFR